MRKPLTGAAIAVLLGGLGAGRAYAAAISFQLTCIAVGSSICAQPGSGTVTVAKDSSDPGKVDVTIGLDGNKKEVKAFLYDPSSSSSTSYLVLAGHVPSYSVGGKHGAGGEPANFTIALAGTGLNPSDFDFGDSSGSLDSALHTGNCNLANCGGDIKNTSAGLPTGATDPVADPGSPPVPGAGSIGSGLDGSTTGTANSSDDDLYFGTGAGVTATLGTNPDVQGFLVVPLSPDPVPEPGSLYVATTGLIGAGFAGLRRPRRRQPQ